MIMERKGAPARDDLGLAVRLPAGAGRIVSLVPSLTESVAASGGRLCGVTDWCTHPAGLDARRVGGTKNPDVAGIVALRPDVVIANDEENRAADLDALRAAGLAVWVTTPRTVQQALTSLGRLLAALHLVDGARYWYRPVVEAWSVAAPVPTHRAAIFIWRRPWMVLGSDTFAGDLLAHLGVGNIFADHPERYPKVALDDVRAREPDLIVLPDEPYAFSPGDGPEEFTGIPVRLVSGRHLTWYGPSLAEAPVVLRRQLEPPMPAT